MAKHSKMLAAKTLRLEAFVEEYSHLSAQGSQQWLKDRQFIIGGSEISTIIGKNKYSNVSGLIAQKLELSSFGGNTATRWGSLFEGMTELIFKILFLEGRAVYTTGSVPHKTILAHSYSPDGLCIVKIKDKYTIVLLEFKAPLCSIPEGRVPVHYLPQVKAGLCTIGLAERGIFMSNMYRKCTLSQLNFKPAYDTQFHRDANKKLEVSEALACGIIMFHVPGRCIDEVLSRLLENYDEDSLSEDDSATYDSSMLMPNKHEFAASDSEYSDDDNCSIAQDCASDSLLEKIAKNIMLYSKTELNAKEYDLMDLGGFSSEEMAEWLELYKSDAQSSFLEARYIKPNINIEAVASEHSNIYISQDLTYVKNKEYLRRTCKRYNFEKTIEKYKTNCLRNGLIPVAVLPWKLIKADVLLVDKDEDFLAQHEQKINDVAGIIKNIYANAGNKDERAMMLEKQYPNNPASKEYWESRPLSLEEILEIVD